MYALEFRVEGLVLWGYLRRWLDKGFNRLGAVTMGRGRGFGGVRIGAWRARLPSPKKHTTRK